MTKVGKRCIWQDAEFYVKWVSVFGGRWWGQRRRRKGEEEVCRDKGKPARCTESQSVSAGHDHSSMPIATRRKQHEWGAVKGHRMVRCWKHSDNSLEEAQCAVGTFKKASTDYEKMRMIWQKGQGMKLLVFAICQLLLHDSLVAAVW